MEPDDGLFNILDELDVFMAQNKDYGFVENPTNATSVRCGTISVKAKIPTTKANISMEPDDDIYFECVMCEELSPGKISGDVECQDCGITFEDGDSVLRTAWSRYFSSSED